VPETADLVPMFPWFGVALLGLIGMRLFATASALAWSSSAIWARALAWIGRWSLIIYLVHQPLLFGLVTPIAGWIDNAQQAKFASFTSSCEASCGAGNDADYCTRYCSCALDITVRDNLWNADADALGSMTRLCTEMAK
jgi:uncharacterized membrane protein